MHAAPPSTGPVLTQPPDPHTKTPTLKAPAGAIDCHIHLFGPASRFPFNPGSRYICQDALPQTQIAMQETLGLAGAVVVSGGGYGPDTRHLEEVLAQYPQRFRGVAHAPERLLWGSDWPHVNMNGRLMPNDGDLFDLLAEWVPDEAMRRKILVDQPRQVYGFTA